MDLIYKVFRLDKNDREGVIAATSILGIIVNIAVASLKIVIGLLASSIAIVSEGVNNAADVMTSLLAFIGSKLAGMHPDESHPFGYGRIEYLASLIISVMIIVTGVEMAISSVKLIFNPAELEVSYVSIAIIFVTALIKYALGAYTIKMGEKTDSGALVGVGTDSKGDSFASAFTIISSLIFLISGKSVDAYAGIIISALIMKAGIDIMKDTVSDLIGRSGESELAKALYKEIRATEGVIGAADMMLHNYGPDSWSGSVNLEIDHKASVGEVYQYLHALQLKIMHEYKVVMVFGIYAVDNDSEDSLALRRVIAEFARSHEHIISYHAVYIDKSSDTIYCDYVVDYKLRDWDGLRQEFENYMSERYPGQKIVCTIETEFV